MKRGKKYVVGERYVLDSSANLCFDILTKNNASINYYNRLLNQDYGWYQSCLFTARRVVGPAFRVTTDMVYDSVKVVFSEMLTAGGEVCREVVVEEIHIGIGLGRDPYHQCK